MDGRTDRGRDGTGECGGVNVFGCGTTHRLRGSGAGNARDRHRSGCFGEQPGRYGDNGAIASRVCGQCGSRCNELRLG
jgi:hypothetical protein